MNSKLFISIFCITLGFSCFKSQAQSIIEQTTVCNPLNLNYRYQFSAPSRREAADPTIVVFKGTYYMFASKTGGYWSSRDLINWKFITSADLPFEYYAPTALVLNDTLCFMALKKRSLQQQIFKTADPSTGNWKGVDFQLSFKSGGDPFLFADDDGRVYFYHGTSSTEPIRGIELDRNTFKPIGEQVDCIQTNSNDYGWERWGDYNTEENRSFLEGAWITKYKGQYYFQYAVPGTQFKSYCDAMYIGDSPLGPFRVAEHNPFSYKPEGFINGAGHSTTFQDKWGNYWHAVTMVISVKHQYERRLGLFPAFFDSEGTFYTYTAFGDFPHKVPQKRMKGSEDYQPSGMLLSYKKPVEVSSAAENHPRELATDEEVRTWWSAATGKKGEWILMDLKTSSKVSAVQINYADEESNISGRPDSIYYQYLLEYSTDTKTWKNLADKTNNKTDVPHDYVELSNAVTARYIRLTNYHVPDGKFAISDLRVFGKGSGKLASVVSSFNVSRDTSDARNVTLTWQKIAGAVGYNIRYGTKPDKLYHNYQVFDADSLTIHSLNRLQRYYYSVDVFNENGITQGSVVKDDGNKVVSKR